MRASTPGFSGQYIDVLGHEDQFAVFYLGMPFCNPGLEMIGIDIGPMRQFFIDCVDDMVQEIGFPQRVAAMAGINDPVGCAGRQYFGLAL